MSDTHRKYLVKQPDRPLGPKAQEIVNLRFAEPKLTQKEIAQRLGITPPRVSHVLNSPRVLSQYRALAKREIGSMVPDAIGAQRDLLRQRENLEVARKVSESVLANEKVLEKDAPTTQINVFNGMNPQELKEFVSKASQTPDFVIDVEPISPELANPLDNPDSPKPQ